MTTSRNPTTRNEWNYPMNTLYTTDDEDWLAMCSSEKRPGNDGFAVESRNNGSILLQSPSHNRHGTDVSVAFSRLVHLEYSKHRSYDHCRNRLTTGQSQRRRRRRKDGDEQAFELINEEVSLTTDVSSSRQTAIVSGKVAFC